MSTLLPSVPAYLSQVWWVLLLQDSLPVHKSTASIVPASPVGQVLPEKCRFALFVQRELHQASLSPWPHYTHCRASSQDIFVPNLNESVAFNRELSYYVLRVNRYVHLAVYDKEMRKWWTTSPFGLPITNIHQQHLSKITKTKQHRTLLWWISSITRTKNAMARLSPSRYRSGCR
jgi:hypothetical protein